MLLEASVQLFGDFEPVFEPLGHLDNILELDGVGPGLSD